MLQALQKFFASLVHSANTSFDTLLDSLLSSTKPSPQSGGLAKQALCSIARCVAVLCLAAGDTKCASTVEMLKGILKDDSTTNSVRILLRIIVVKFWLAATLNFSFSMCPVMFFLLTQLF